MTLPLGLWGISAMLKVGGMGQGQEISFGLVDPFLWGMQG